MLLVFIAPALNGCCAVMHRATASIPPKEGFPPDLPPSEGPDQQQDDKKTYVTLRLLGHNGAMVYEIGSRRGSNISRSPTTINGGTVQQLMADTRSLEGSTRYRKIVDDVLHGLQAKATDIPDVEGIAFTYLLEDNTASELKVNDTTPWGFVTLALDACAEFNKQRRQQGERELTITFKHTEPSSK